MKQKILILAMILGLFIARVQAQVPVFTESFENGIPSSWTIMDADGDHETWQGSLIHDPLYGEAHTGTGYAFSCSYDEESYTALTPDNWLITPGIVLNGSSTLTFWVFVNPYYPAEHFGVYVSTTSPTNTSSFTLLYEETATSAGYDWTMRTVDLSNYTGDTVYVAFRHFNCTDKAELALDDIVVTSVSSQPSLLVNPVTLHFDNAVMGMATDAQEVTVSAFNLTSAVTATATTPFEVSANNITFGNTASLPATGGTLYVRYFPSVEGTDSGIVRIANGMLADTMILTGTNNDCSAIALPYVQNFDDTEVGNLPPCWHRINAFEYMGDLYPSATASHSHGSGNALEFQNDGTMSSPVFAVLPKMAPDLSSLQISFWTRREGSSSGTLSVGYVTRLNDYSTFVPVWSKTAAEMGNDVYQPFVVNFSNVTTNPALNYYIAYRYVSSTEWFWYVDDITVELLSSCDAPSELAVGTVTSNSVRLSWAGNADSYELYYKVSTDSVWDTVRNVTMGANGYLLANLLPSTTYEWFVAAVCDDSSLVNSMTTAYFTTDCAPVNAPFYESFDAQGSTPACWTQWKGLASDAFAGAALESVGGGWYFSRPQVFGEYHPVLNVQGENCKNWLVTPAINLSTLTNPCLIFNLALTNYNSAAPISTETTQSDDQFMVLISTDNGAMWSASNAIVWNNDGTGNYVFNQIPAIGQEFTIPLTNYANQTIKIAFYGESTESDNGDNDLRIDNVNVVEFTSCTRPSQFALASVTTSSVTLSWAENGTATAWNIEYGQAGFSHGSPAATRVSTTTRPFTINNLTTGVPYEFYVRSNCGAEQSLWVGPLSATPGAYFVPTSRVDTLTTCSIAIYDNAGPNTDYNADCNGALVIYPETVGGSISVSGTYDTEENYDVLSIYDGVGFGGALLGEFSGTGTIPALVSTTGPMTIQFVSDSYFQKEGFALTVSCVTCTPPTNITVSNIQTTSVLLSWLDNGAASWRVEYKAVGDSAWIVRNVSDTMITLTDLSVSTIYEVRVSSNCGEEYSSPYLTSFTTAMIAVPLPYSTDFSATADQNWVLNNGTCTNQWTIGTHADEGDALFISKNGIIAAYDFSAYSVVSAEKLFTVGTAENINISFDVKVGGEDYFDYLKVFFAPSDNNYPAAMNMVSYAGNEYMEYAVDFTNFLQYSTVQTYPFKFNLTNGNTVHVDVTMPNPNVTPTAASTAKLVFLWKNDNREGNQPGAVVDNISLSPTTCFSPSDLSISEITTTSAVVMWTADSAQTLWNLQYKTISDTSWTQVPVVGTPSCLLTGLTPGTLYQVRVQTNCGDDAVSFWLTGTFVTNCATVTAFPYTEDFEYGGSMPECWTQEYVSGDEDWIINMGNNTSLVNAHSGTYNAFFLRASYDHDATKLVTPVFDLSELTNPYVTYWHSQTKWGNDQDTLKVYYRTSASDEWHQLVEYSDNLPLWTKDSLQLPNPSASYQLAFEAVSNYGRGITLDDVTIWGDTTALVILTEPTATTIAASNIEQTVATLNGVIYNPDSVTIIAQGFEWKTTSGDNYVMVAATGDTMSYTLTVLAPNTDYTFRAFVATANGTTYGDTLTFRTLEEVILPCDAPADLNTSNITHESITVTWADNDYVSSWTLIYRELNGQNTLVTVYTNSYTITDLNPQTEYQIQVRANCGNEVSGWISTSAITLVGINSYLENSVTLYPNPAKEVVNVQCTMNNVQFDGAEIEVLDVYGKLLQTLKVDSETTQINVSGLADGMYFVRVTTEQGVVMKRFVKR